MVAKVAVISVVKDECDIIELFVKINSRMVDHLYVVDHNSRDKTLEILMCLKDGGYPLTMFRNDAADFRQSLILSSLLREVARSGAYDFIVPLDADEFIYCEQGRLADAIEASIPKATCGQMAWASYVPSAGDYYGSAAPLYDVFRRRSAEHKPVHKVVIPKEFALTCLIAEGNHYVTIDGQRPPMVTVSPVLQHLPVRSLDQLLAKVLINSQRLLIKEGRGKRESQHWVDMAEKIRRAGYRLSHAEMVEIAWRYGIEPDQEAGVLSVDEAAPRVGLPTDRIELRELSHINLTKRMDECMTDLCAEIVRLRLARDASNRAADLS